MPVSIARRLLPPGTVIGVSCNTVEQVKRAVKDGADYIGIGAVWATTTKTLTSPIIGVRGVGDMLQVLDGTGIKAVGIGVCLCGSHSTFLCRRFRGRGTGGIKASNLLRTLYGSVSQTGHALDGVAVFSEIMTSPLPMETAHEMKGIVGAFKDGLRAQMSGPRRGLWASPDGTSIVEGVCTLVEQVRASGPLIHQVCMAELLARRAVWLSASQITNTVVATQSANVTLALGASPIMATEVQEMQDLAKLSGALLINIGTLKSDVKAGILCAGMLHLCHLHSKVVDDDGQFQGILPMQTESQSSLTQLEWARHPIEKRR